MMDDLHKLLGKSVYACLILPAPSIPYYRRNLQNLVDSLEERDDVELEVKQTNEKYIEVKVAVTKPKEEYTTDWDILLERINECNQLRQENEQLKKWNKCLAEKRHKELHNPCGGW